MRCVFVDVMPPPMRLDIDAPTASLALEYLSACSRRAGHESLIIDGYSYSLQPEEIAERINRVRGPFVLGFALMSARSLERVERVLACLDRQRCDVRHVCTGGYYATFNYERVLRRCPSIDSVLRFETETSFLELLARLADGKPCEDVRGRAYRSGDEIVYTGDPRFIVDLDEIPHPDRSHERPDATATYLQTSRGCYAKCTFCMNIMFANPKGYPAWRFRSAESIADEIERLARDRGIRHVAIIDENFLGGRPESQERAHALADLMIRRRVAVSFNVSARANDIDVDLLKHLREAGLSNILLGIESGSDEFLRTIRKGIKAAMNVRGIETVRAAGVALSLGFMPYRTGTTLDTLEQELRFLEANVCGTRLSPGLAMQLQGHLWVYEGSPIHLSLVSAGEPLERDDLTENMFRYRERPEVVRFRLFNNNAMRIIETTGKKIRAMQLPDDLYYDYQIALDRLALRSTLESLAYFRRDTSLSDSELSERLMPKLTREVSEIYFLAELERRCRERWWAPRSAPHHTATVSHPVQSSRTP